MRRCIMNEPTRTYLESEKDTQDQIEELQATCIVKNAAGIHVRPAGVIVRLFDGEPCDVHFTYAGKTINAKSIMSILMLGAPQGGEILVTIRSKEAHRILQKIQDAFSSGFGEL
ncbi:Phosphocarrier protein HPr [Chlamydia pneumoniae]|nr:Phosphocarrier protein HPr [Chlamydia pneumoniae]CRI35393.1 Phosphocarrier protein HPr [Chlamydia pneumoniae]CRI36520.1 Phosphocarrier protein HPr [Chlamydia pneumoniae]CRI37644.1 Phosphocarrier protein HPr [Chlamydia pneumoniae]CRI38777.1 Phosphocarrier protein HPr [Chlamydia pneumoniae]